MRFISRDNDNDVAVRIFCLISNIPREKRTRVRDVCNALNNKIRYLKFSLDTDGDIQVMYDFPVCTPDDGIGEMALEMLACTQMALDSEYNLFMKALYTEEPLEDLE